MLSLARSVSESVVTVLMARATAAAAMFAIGFACPVSSGAQEIRTQPLPLVWVLGTGGTIAGQPNTDMIGALVTSGVKGIVFAGTGAVGSQVWKDRP